MKNSLCSLNKPGECVPDEEISKIEKKQSTSLESLVDKYQCSKSSDTTLCVMESLGEDKTIAAYYKPITKSFDKMHWLNNTEIDHVQYQFMINYPGYYYSNIHMIDLGMFDPSNKDLLDYSPSQINNIDFVNELKSPNLFTSNGPLKYYGLVVNTDVSSGRGIHWFAIFMDFTSSPMTIEYFNSSGYDIRKKDFKSFMLNLADDLTVAGMPCKFVKVSDIQHQSEDTSNCGVYSLYYIWKRLGGTPYEEFGKKKVSDECVVTFREYFFRKSTQE